LLINDVKMCLGPPAGEPVDTGLVPATGAALKYLVRKNDKAYKPYV
jgi:hypothetical protein